MRHTMLRHGDSESNILSVQSNIANTYKNLGRMEEALQLKRDVYSGYSRHFGEENVNALMAATNYANTLVEMQRFKEARKLMRKTMPVVRRVLGENDDVTLKIRSIYAQTLFHAPSATIDDLRAAVTTLEDTARPRGACLAARIRS